VPQVPNYAVVFDIGEQTYPAPIGPLLFMCAVIGLLAAISARLWLQRSISNQGKSIRFVTTGVAVGLVGITSLMWFMKANHEELVQTIRAGNVNVAEGIVKNFHPMPTAGHDTEHFTVGGRQFAYSDYVITGGFNNTASHGGPIKEGLQVRITYAQARNGTIILKVEVATGA
jgi:hypothetical protein